MKKILEIIGTSSGGGAEKQCKNIAKTFALKGFKVYLVCPQGSYNDEFAKLSEFGVEIIIYEAICSKIKIIFLLRQLIQEKGINVIHSHQYTADLCASIARVGFPSVIHISTIHNLLKASFAIKTPLYKKIKYYVLWFLAFHSMNKIFAVSDYANIETRKFFFIRKKKILTALNGLDFNDININQNESEIIKKKYNILETDLVISYMAAFYPLKAHADLINAVGIYMNGKDIKLILPGIGSDFIKCKELAESYGIQNKVIMPGFQNDIFPWYSLSTIYVHPSLNECLPLTILEAMYCNLPIIATNLPCHAELINHKKSGILVEPNSPQQIAEAIEFLIEYPELASSFGKRAGKFVREFCSIDAMVEKMIPYF